MFRWSSEHNYISRYLGSGALNTIVGFSVIFVLMGLGVSPYIANMGGYMVGFVLGFVVSKKFVFRSNGHVFNESMKYLIAFVFCFALNFLVLNIALSVLHLESVVAQVLAGGAYTLSMYAIMRCFVFQNDLNLERLKIWLEKMTAAESLSRSKENPFMLKAVWLILGLITLSAIVLINNYSPFIPDYDGLSYFESVKIVNNWQFKVRDLKFPGAWVFVSFWPITNGPSVMLAAIFRHTVDINLLPTMINALYLILFTVYISKIRSSSYAYVAILLLCANSFFYRLFTTLTSEFSVGLWIFAYLLTLLSTHNRRGLYLSALIILGVLLRTIDIVFVLCASTAYILLNYLLWKDKAHVLATLRSIGLTVILTAPLFFNHYKAAYIYVRESQSGISSVSWKAMADAFGGLDIPLKYVEYITIYNPLLIPLTIMVIILVLFSKALANKSALLIVGISFALIFPLLMAATINIMTVFWIFSVLVFIVCELGLNLWIKINNKINNFSIISTALNIFGIVVVSFFTLFFMHLSWGMETKYLQELKARSEIGFEISAVLKEIPGTKYVTSNCRGIGTIDNIGLSWGSSDELIEGSIQDVYSRKKNINDYLEFNDKVSFFISAHDNYFCPLMFGINDHVKALNNLFASKSQEFGFRKVSEIARNNTNFDIWYRPNVQQPYLQYAGFGDNWISSNLSIEIGSKKLCAEEKVGGKIFLSVNFPNPNIANYTPPFLIALHSKNSKEIITSAIVNNYGNADVILDLKNIVCGEYELSFDKAFSTKADPRELSAQFIKLDSALKFEPSKL
jgi:putative flippase GtrA